MNDHSCTASDAGEENVEEALNRLRQLEARYSAQEDARAIFTGAYVVITAAMQEALNAGRFLDGAWVERYLTAFARLYLEAAHQYETDLELGTGAAPAAWQIAFETCRHFNVSPLVHLLLGINAHVNRDLAVALVQAGISERLHERYEDHTRVNDVLSEAVNALQARVTSSTPSLARLDGVMGHWDEQVACRTVAWARELAWSQAVRLTRVHGALYDQHLERMERRAYQYALIIRGRAVMLSEQSDR
ncbi:DUF5995 family protein [Deinococcus navajonensis]|uniref:DUF5995 family protein n=1 Tax=Deinococcus navajonensis TaxID=309884 RepID=A0ABV8XKH8_9DEIO